MVPATEKQKLSFYQVTFLVGGILQEVEVGKSDVCLAYAIPAKLPYVTFLRTFHGRWIALVKLWETIDEFSAIHYGAIVAVVDIARHGTIVRRLPVFVFPEVPAAVVVVGYRLGNSGI